MCLTRAGCVRVHVWLSGISQIPNLFSPTLPLSLLLSLLQPLQGPA